MANLTITAAEVSPVQVFEQITAPTDEAISAGQMARYATATGKLTKGNGSTAAEARILGVAITTVTAAGANACTVVKRGIVDLGDALDAVAYDAPIYASDTDGTLADTAGTVSTVIGRVIPGWGATTADKLLFVDRAL